MIDFQQIKGYWFFTDHLEKRFIGVLTFCPDKPIRLHLTDQFTVEEIRKFAFLRNVTIWGYSVKGEEVTLFECNNIEIGHSPVGIHDITLNASQILVGLHIKDIETRLFKSARISFKGIETWMRSYGYEIKIEKESRDYAIVYKKPANITFKLPGQVLGSISYWNSVPYREVAEITLLQNNFLQLDFEQPSSFENIRRLVWNFQQFLTIVMWQKTAIKWFFLDFDTKEYFEPHSEVEMQSKDVQVFYQQASFGSSSDNDNTHLLPFHIIKPHFEVMIERWYVLEEKVNPVIDILYANIGISNEYVRNNFLNMVQAVEAYHRRMLQNTEDLKKMKEEQVNRVLGLIPDHKDKEWLRQQLIYSYEPSLRKRLNDLFSVHGREVLLNISENKRGLASLISFLVEKRNYFTHYDPSLEEKDLDIGKLIQCVDVLKILLAVLFLKEMGLSETIITNSIPQRMKFQFGK
jgi:hypothetical protein